MGSVFSYHILMYFIPWPWHAKNGVSTTALVPVSQALLAWIMPLMFLISGFATQAALRKGHAASFVKARLLRLGLPLLTAIFLLSPFQVYSERIINGQFAGTFWQFLPHYFDGLYFVTPQGNFAWMGLHLWYVLVLLVFSLITLPVFLRWRAAPDRPAAMASPAGVLVGIPFLLLALEGLLFALGMNASQSGWPFGVYLALYVLGYYVVSAPRFAESVRRVGPWAWGGVLLTVVPVAVVPEPGQFGLVFVLWQAAKVANSWFWMVGLSFLADRFGRRGSGLLDECNEAVMPFYMLHQPVIVGLGFAVRTLSLPIPIKLPLLWMATFALILLLYHGAVRRFNLLRPLFGLKSLTRA